jgi:Icc protein
MFPYYKTLIRPLSRNAPSAKLLWLSDPHFDSRDRWSGGHDDFLHQLSQRDFDHLVITGDISNARYIERDLLSLSEAAGRRSIKFVLGNHDFYGSSFNDVDRAVAQLCRQRSNLHHLGYGEIIKVNNQVALIGQRGWADGKAGHGRHTLSPFKDANWIADFKDDSKDTVFRKMARLGETSGDYFRKMVSRALATFMLVIVVTHVPPFVSAALRCHEEEQPFFINSSAGYGLKQSLSEHPDKLLMVLCGHTHRANTYDETPRLRVHVGGKRRMESLLFA